ncbi:hypothetical protein ACOSQ2_023082 [Xanthoceras sorbifolium]
MDNRTSENLDQHSDDGCVQQLADLDDIVKGGRVDSLLEWPSKRSLKRCDWRLASPFLSFTAQYDYVVLVPILKGFSFDCVLVRF